MTKLEQSLSTSAYKLELKPYKGGNGSQKPLISAFLCEILQEVERQQHFTFIMFLVMKLAQHDVEGVVSCFMQKYNELGGWWLLLGRRFLLSTR